MPTVDQILPQTIVAENPYTTQPKSLSKNCVKQEEHANSEKKLFFAYGMSVNEGGSNQFFSFYFMDP